MERTKRGSDDSPLALESFADAHLRTLRVGYEVTRNPVWVWWAIHWCRNESPQRELPNWCLGYLGEVAGRLNALGQSGDVIGNTGKGRGRAPPTPDAGKIIAAFGLLSKGKNLFREAESDLRKMRAATRYVSAQRQGVPSKEALASVKDWLGEDDDSNARKIIREGKRLLRG